MWIITKHVQKLISVIFPTKCYICHIKEEPLCKECLENCLRYINDESIFIKSTYDFRDRNIKKIIHEIKYYGRRDLVEPLSNKLAEEIILEKETKKNLILVPIPMPRFRKYIRGYNQAEEIAKILGEKTNTKIQTNILKRIRSPKHQVKTKNKEERLKNQKNSFGIVSDVKNLNIILVDDVATTGATLEEARNILLKNGAGSVIGMTLAH